MPNKFEELVDLCRSCGIKVDLNPFCSRGNNYRSGWIELDFRNEYLPEYLKRTGLSLIEYQFYGLLHELGHATHLDEHINSFTSKVEEEQDAWERAYHIHCLLWGEPPLEFHIAWIDAIQTYHQAAAELAALPEEKRRRPKW
ncbi:hypothetical protein H6G33_09645 [Calothrix sp. FACHB-1219]|uniref:hypothetical protein n=1 Tax=unclassified Calothrix TaxID=2619626 RepID=UPI001685F1E2|nr:MULTISPECIES: hypothetical protein [unclassified Calothrix]MBD2201610.1 hypothetical protein [Calothrix sp. FACHB-168]MBD2217296.1 hypothetical protein [Calothrix sp. FACHB-1219]